MKEAPLPHSCIYDGSVSHRRFSPVSNSFKYSTFMMYLDLDELPTLFDGRLMWSVTRPALARFRRSDFHGDVQDDLQVTVRNTVESMLGFRPDGPIRMLAHLRYFGICFNPVSFYFCFDGQGELQAIMSEITNTPWGERHVYCMDWRNADDDQQRFAFDKQFHVSPFMQMDLRYDWRFSVPDETLNVFMANKRNGEKVFDANLRLTRREITPSRLNWLLVRHPIHSAKVLGGIYWQALKLKLKGSPIHDHPKQQTAQDKDCIHGRT